MLQDTPSQFARRVVARAIGESRSANDRGGGRCRRGGCRAGDELVAASGNILILVCVGPNPLGVLRKNSDDVFDLIFDLPSKTKIVQTNVGRVESSFFKLRLSGGDAEIVDFLTGNLTLPTGFAVGRRPVRETYWISRERTLVDGVLVDCSLTVQPLVAGKVFKVEVAVDNVFRNIVSDKSGVFDEQLFDIVTRHFFGFLLRLWFFSCIALRVTKTILALSPSCEPKGLYTQLQTVT